MSQTTLIKLAGEIGFSHYGSVNMDALVPSAEVRAMCAADRCQLYGRSWGCPPACGSIAHFRQIIAQYSQGILVQTTADLEDPFDISAMAAAEKLHKSHFDTLVRQTRLLMPDCFPMASGGCTRCRKCTYPHRPCRHPDKRCFSMEACGLMVSDVCTKSGLSYYYGPNTMTYTACILTGRRNE